ncbi:DUF2637 domain-containing protein [Streptomyces sp. NPDC000075]
MQVRTTSWDRAAVVALGAAGCALSYDALQQMATAIHVRGYLTAVFPLVIDGFIAYGVRALLVLRTASLAARCYVWLLFGTATSASIGANALHAVRLNQQTAGTGLRLGDTTVGLMSTLAPLALAGAVHLYILIARRVTELPVRDDLNDAGQSAHPLTGSVPQPQHTHTGGDDQGGQPVTRPAPVTRRVHAKVTVPADEPRPDTAATGHQDTTPVTDALLPIARRAVAEADRITRQVVADAVRGQGLPLSNDRLTVLMSQLRSEARTASGTGPAARQTPAPH